MILPEFTGEFETHITVEPLDAAGRERFRIVCTSLGLKPVLIELSRGSVPIQPMTASVAPGNLEDIRKQASRDADALQAAGFTVVRVKVEASPYNADIPQTRGAANYLPANFYFEYHARLQMPGFESLALITPVCEAHGAHLSRNAFKELPDGTYERFVTQRAYSVGLQEAQESFHRLREALERAGVPILKEVTEYCVFDSNDLIDEAWLDI